jgi:transposase
MSDKARISILESQLAAAESRAAAAESRAAAAESRAAAAESRLVDLESKISKLELLLLRPSITKTSSNSHNPPSSDKFVQRSSLREKSERPVGGQKGHKGHTLKMTTTPDSIEDIRPGYCNHCGGDLCEHEQVLVERRQVVDIPLVTPHTKEYRSYAIQCTCGHRQCGAFPQGVDNHVQYGPNLQSLVVYQSFYQFMPFGRLCDFLDKVCGVSMSKGTIENILRRSAKAVEEAKSIGADETPFNSQGKKHWFFVWQTTLATYLVAACSRKKDVIVEQFPNGFPEATLASDRLSAQLNTPAKKHQACLAHLLRDLKYLAELEQSTWATKLTQLFKDALQLKQIQPAYDPEDELVKKIEERTDILLNSEYELELTKEPLLYQKTSTFFMSMRKNRDHLFPFLYDKDVPPDNNGSERAFRMVKVKTKISGQFKSLQDDFAVIRSVIDTAVKNGQTAMEAIRAIVDMPLQPQPQAAG